MQNIVLSVAGFLMDPPTTTTAGANDWSLMDFLGGVVETVGGVGRLVTMLIGGLMLIMGLVKLFRNLALHGKVQADWGITIMLLLFGGALAVAGAWQWIGNLTQTTQKSIDEIGKSGTSDPTLFT